MKILIGADVVPTKATEQLFIEQDTKTLFGDVYDIIKQADRTVINLECALTTSEKNIKKIGPCLKANPKCGNTLKAIGVTDIMLANNHVFDFGVQGLVDTMNTLKEIGLPYMGVGDNDNLSRTPYIIEQDGKKIGFVNVCEHEYSYALSNRIGTNPYDPYLTMRDIRALKKEVDFVIVLYHGGKEHCRYPSPRLRLLCQEMVENGANVVITQHSHCIGCYEEYKDGHIVYGQGNFHFCWEGRGESWYTGLLIELIIEKEIKIKFHPFLTLEKGIELAKGEKYEQIMDEFAQRNLQLKNGEWKAGWHEFCMRSYKNYESILRGLGTAETTEGQTELFAHYLDCEAHTDVWREIYPTWNLTNEIKD